MQASRLQILLTVFAGVFLLGTVLIFAVFALAPGTAVVYRPILLTAFVVTLFVSLVCIAWLLRGLLRPYSQLVGEARRAPVAHSAERFSDRIVASMPTALIAFDSAGKATVMNRPARTLFEVTQSRSENK